jgi:hypothetical protein
LQNTPANESTNVALSKLDGFLSNIVKEKSKSKEGQNLEKLTETFEQIEEAQDDEMIVISLVSSVVSNLNSFRVYFQILTRFECNFIS